jgi:predicted transcriptional regulator
MFREKHPSSISNLPEISVRNIKNVSDDMKALVNVGLVEISQTGKCKAPNLRYVKITVRLAGKAVYALRKVTSEPVFGVIKG